MVKLETIFPDLLKETYIIHETGGLHPFRSVEDAAPIFKEDCWPYVQRIHWPVQKDRANKWREENGRAPQINLNISFRHPYPYHNFSKEGFRESPTKNGRIRILQNALYIKMHSAVGKAFIPNPENKPQVCHINDDPCDYRLENLIWGTNRENHTGRRGNIHTQKNFNIIHSIFKMNGWAQG